MSNRKTIQHVIKWASGNATSNAVNLSEGCFGTIIVPVALNGLTIQVVTELDGKLGGQDWVSGLTTPAAFDAVSLLSPVKTLATGANALTTDEIRQIGAMGWVRFILSAAAGADTEAVLWWKS